MAKVVGGCHRRTHNCSEIWSRLLLQLAKKNESARITQRGRIIITAASHSVYITLKACCRADALVFTNRYSQLKKKLIYSFLFLDRKSKPYRNQYKRELYGLMLAGCTPLRRYIIRAAISRFTDSSNDQPDELFLPLNSHDYLPPPAPA